MAHPNGVGGAHPETTAIHSPLFGRMVKWTVFPGSRRAWAQRGSRSALPTHRPSFPCEELSPRYRPSRTPYPMIFFTPRVPEKPSGAPWVPLPQFASAEARGNHGDSLDDNSEDSRVHAQASLFFWNYFRNIFRGSAPIDKGKIRHPGVYAHPRLVCSWSPKANKQVTPWFTASTKT